MRITVPVAALLLVAACDRTAPMQEELTSFLPNATVVAGEPVCGECSLDLQLVVDLAEARDRDAITGDIRALVSTGDGILVSFVVPGQPLLFAADGRLSRRIGSRGDSADGFLGASLMRDGYADSIVVLDDHNKRITVLKPGLVPARTIPLNAAVTDMAVLADGQVLLATAASAASRDSTVPLQVLSLSTGELQPLPATALQVPRGAGADYSRRIIAPSRDGMHFWSAHRLRYAIEKRTLNGDLVQVLERDVSWFRPSGAATAVSADSAPASYVAGIWEDGRGLLWVHTVTPDKRWRDALGQVQSVAGDFKPTVLSGDLYRDTRIEVIDPETGALIATTKIDTELPSFASGPYLARVTKGPAGWLTAEVWTVRLSGIRNR